VFCVVPQIAIDRWLFEKGPPFFNNRPVKMTLYSCPATWLKSDVLLLLQLLAAAALLAHSSLPFGLHNTVITF
jgi:hypothetical protein